MHAKYILVAISAAFVAAQDTTNALDALTSAADDQFESLTDILDPEVVTSLSESVSSVIEDATASEPTATDMTDMMTDMTTATATDPAATGDMTDDMAEDMTDSAGETTATGTSDPSGTDGGADATDGTMSEEAGAAMTAAPVLAAGVLAMLAAL